MYNINFRNRNWYKKKYRFLQLISINRCYDTNLSTTCFQHLKPVTHNEVKTKRY